MPTKILLIDDEAPLRDSLVYAFTREGFEITTAVDAETALAEMETSSPDVVLLDVMLPGLDGFQLCNRLRAQSDVPIVMLTARDQVADRLRGFEFGADDYVTKPFNTRELVARVRSVVRRREGAKRLLDESRAVLARIDEVGARVPKAPSSHRVDKLVAGEITLDVVERRAVVRGREIVLGDAEAEILAALIREHRRVVTRSELIAAVWSDRGNESLPMLEALVRSLRLKIEVDPARPRLLVSVPGIGFQLM